MKENYIGNTHSAVNSEPVVYRVDDYTQRRLEEFDETFADYFVIKTGLMSDHKGSTKPSSPPQFTKP